MGKHLWWEGIWEITRKDRSGRVLSHEEIRNALADEGEMNVLDSYFRNQNSPAQFYFRLCNDTMAETKTLATILGEPSGNGYLAQMVERSAVGFPTLEIDAGDYRVISKEITFTASGGDIGPVNNAYIATTNDNTGKLIAYVPLSQPRTILDGDSLVIRMRIKMQ